MFLDRCRGSIPRFGDRLEDFGTQAKIGEIHMLPDIAAYQRDCRGDRSVAGWWAQYSTRPRMSTTPRAAPRWPGTGGVLVIRRPVARFATAVDVVDMGIEARGVKGGGAG